VAEEELHVFYESDGRMKCPYCGALLNGHSDMAPDARAPQPGDFSLCVHCRGVGVYTHGDDGRLFVRPPTPAETAEYQAMAPADPLANLRQIRDMLKGAGVYGAHPWDRPL
jgi:hypothetical protein